MMFETHRMSFPFTELLLFNFAKVNTVFNKTYQKYIAFRGK